MQKAVITGITGQDGSYLTALLLEKGYKVFGTFRRTSSVNFWRLSELGVLDHPNLTLIEYDVTDLSSSIRLLEKAEPDEFYNLAAQSFVGVSFDQPITTAEITGLGVLNILEAIRIVDNRIRFYQASTSEMFGEVQEVPQTEMTPFYPRSPYGCAKLFAHWTTINYRESYDIFGASGILFNHESPLRGKEFVTRKITDTVAKIVLGEATKIELGNMEAKRDWGFAQEYVEGMWRILQADTPDTYVLATNKTHTVRDFVIQAFSAGGIEIDFQGIGESEKAIVTGVERREEDRNSLQVGDEVVSVNPKFYRPAEVELLIGDAAKVKSELGWEAKIGMTELVKMMVDSDIDRNSNGFSF